MFETKLPYYREIIRFCVARSRIYAFNPNSAVVRYCDITTANITRGYILFTLYIYVSVCVCVNIVVYRRRVEYIIIINAVTRGNVTDGVRVLDLREYYTNNLTILYYIERCIGICVWDVFTMSLGPE